MSDIDEERILRSRNITLALRVELFVHPERIYPVPPHLQYRKVQQPPHDDRRAEQKEFFRESPAFDIAKLSGKLELLDGTLRQLQPPQRLLEYVRI